MLPPLPASLVLEALLAPSPPAPPAAPDVEAPSPELLIALLAGLLASAPPPPPASPVDPFDPPAPLDDMPELLVAALVDEFAACALLAVVLGPSAPTLLPRPPAPAVSVDAGSPQLTAPEATARATANLRINALRAPPRLPAMAVTAVATRRWRFELIRIGGLSRWAQRRLSIAAMCRPTFQAIRRPAYFR
jgi:hypothetical protein